MNGKLWNIFYTNAESQEALVDCYKCHAWVYLKWKICYLTLEGLKWD
jgi:hypothetical protein